jgi:uncharacterized protein (DUF952 family)
MKPIFHITTRQAWQTAESVGVYKAETLDTEGFIHLSSPHQVVNVANLFFKGQSDLVLLHVNEDLITSPIKYELVADDRYPHVYGPLNLDAVIGVYDFSENGLQGFSMPAQSGFLNVHE